MSKFIDQCLDWLLAISILLFLTGYVEIWLSLACIVVFTVNAAVHAIATMCCSQSPLELGDGQPTGILANQGEDENIEEDEGWNFGEDGFDEDE